MNFPPMRALEFITGHVIYTYKFQLKTTNIALIWTQEHTGWFIKQEIEIGFKMDPLQNHPWLEVLIAFFAAPF